MGLAKAIGGCCISSLMLMLLAFYFHELSDPRMPKNLDTVLFVIGGLVGWTGSVIGFYSELRRGDELDRMGSSIQTYLSVKSNLDSDGNISVRDK